MLTTEPTEEMVAAWKKIYETVSLSLAPNRKSGVEVDRYFRETYPCRPLDHPELREITALQILENEHFRSKLPAGAYPDIQTYRTGNVLVAIDLCTGEFHGESEAIEEVIPIFDDLFVYRGLDEADLKNFFLVAEYVTLVSQ